MIGHIELFKTYPRLSKNVRKQDKTEILRNETYGEG